MQKNYIKELLENHKGKLFGVFSGLLIGVLILIIGFWKVIFLALCVGLGVWLGTMKDNKENFLSFMDKIIGKIYKDN